MGNILYAVAVVLLISWTVGFFGYAAGGLIHILPVLAFVILVARILRGRKII